MFRLLHNVFVKPSRVDSVDLGQEKELVVVGGGLVGERRRRR